MSARLYFPHLPTGAGGMNRAGRKKRAMEGEGVENGSMADGKVKNRDPTLCREFVRQGDQL